MNQITISGWVATEPKQISTEGGSDMAAFRLAYRPGKDRPTQFFDVVAFDNVATNFLERINKGRSVAIAGRISQREYTDKTGSKREQVSIVANSIHYGEETSKDVTTPDASEVFDASTEPQADAADQTQKVEVSA